MISVEYGKITRLVKDIKEVEKYKSSGKLN